MKAAGWIVVGVGLAAGCAVQPRTAARNHPATQAPLAAPRASAALAFDPPLTRDEPSIDPYLSRTGRGEAAFAGFEQTSTSYFDIATYNEDGPYGCDRVDRQTYINQVGSISR